MSNIVKYTNEFGHDITSQQINDIDGYFKVFYENNQVVKRERYESGELKNTSYVMYSQSDIDSFLLNNPNVSIEYQHIEASYNLIEYISYVQGAIMEKMVVVFNSTGAIICFKKYKIVNSVLTAIRTDKHYYDINNQEKYFFVYNEDGTCFEVCDLQIDNADFYAWSIGVDPEVTFTWTGFEYYKYAEPLIPN